MNEMKERWERRNKHNMAQLPDELQEVVRMQIAAGKLDEAEFFDRLNQMRVYRFTPEQRNTIVRSAISSSRPNVRIANIVKNDAEHEESEVRV